MAKLGLSQPKLAKEVDVTKEAVSNWLRGESFPRADALLRLGMALGLPFEQLVTGAQKSPEPLVAYRTSRKRTADGDAIERAKDMGRQLRRLVPYLGFDALEVPPTLQSPKDDYDYINAVASKLRAELGIGAMDPVTVETLIGKFKSLQAVIVPVLWGRSRRGHENALHIHLPDSQTTWVFLNLDALVDDFKHWMGHELGHALSFRELQDERGESFSENFAGALLFPNTVAAETYECLRTATGLDAKFAVLDEAARGYGISDISVLKEVDRFAQHCGHGKTGLEDKHFYVRQHAKRKDGETMAQHIFGTAAEVEAGTYVTKTTSFFRTPVFSALSQFFNEQGTSAAYLAEALNVKLQDAAAICRALARPGQSQGSGASGGSTPNLVR